MSGRIIAVLIVALLTLSTVLASQEASNHDDSSVYQSFTKESPSPPSNVVESSLPTRYMQVEVSAQSKIDLRSHERISEAHSESGTSPTSLRQQEMVPSS